MKGATSAQIPASPPGEGSLLMDTTQELVTALSTDLDATGAEIQEVKRKLRKTIREKAILEAPLRGDPDYPRSTTAMSLSSTCQSHIPGSAFTTESPAAAPATVRDARSRSLS
jgi:hypothetical protein